VLLLRFILSIFAVFIPISTLDKSSDFWKNYSHSVYCELLPLFTKWRNTKQTNTIGNHVDADNLRLRSFSPLLERAGLPTIRFHDLRHTSATLLLSLGTNPKVVQELLGHSGIAVTMDVYSHVLPTMQQEAMSDMDKLLSA